MASLVHLVWATSRKTIEPADYAEMLRPHGAVICAFWHGQQMMTGRLTPRGMRFAVLISRHRDGEIQAATAARFGASVVRGSGGHGAGDYGRKGGARALRELLRCLGGGTSVVLTADVPKGPARQSGEGIVRLSQLSGRPIVPIAVATRRHRVFDRSWDKATLNLPFTRLAAVVGEPILVPREAKDVVPWQARVTAALDTVTERAYTLVGSRDAFMEAVPAGSGHV